MRWEQGQHRPDASVCTSADGAWLGTAWSNGDWRVYGTLRQRADPPTLEAAQAALEAELWARVAVGLVGR